MRDHTKRPVACFLAALLIGSLFSFQIAAAADQPSYVPLSTGGAITCSGITKLETAVNTETKWFPWAVSKDGDSLCSGNQKISGSYSVLRVTVTGSGVLAYKYRLSTPIKGGNNDWDACTETNPDSLLVWQRHDANDVLKAYYSTAVGEYGAARVYGEEDWKLGVTKVTATANETTEVYFAYKKNGSINGKQDCVWLKDIIFSDGSARVEPVSSDPDRGSVTPASWEGQTGDELTLTAVPADGCRFYGWIMDGILVSTDPQYTFTVMGNMAPMAVFGRDGVTAVRNVTRGLVYDDPASALRDARSGDTVLLLRDAALTENAVIPAGVALYVPYDETVSTTGTRDGTAADSPKLAATDKAFRTLTVESGVTLTVDGTLRLGGVIGYPGQFYQGHTSGAFGRMVNRGTVTVASGGVLDCFGMVDGEGQVTAQSGAAVYEPFIVYDYSGGSNTLALKNAGQSPFSQYTMQNIRCPLRIESGALLGGRCNLYASGMFNKTDSAAVIVGCGHAPGIVTLSDGAVLTRTVDPAAVIRGYNDDLGRVTYDITGGADFGDLKMNVLGVLVSTADAAFFPMPYGYAYVLRGGEYAVTGKLGVLPGAAITVGADAALTVKGALYVTEGLKQNSLSGKYYPTTDMLKQAGLATGGVLTVNGRMTVAGGAAFGGIVQAGAVGGTVEVQSGGKCEQSLQIGARAAYGDTTTILPLNGRVWNGMRLVTLIPGKSYTALSGDAWTLADYTVTSYTTGSISSTDKTDTTQTHGPETVPVAQTMHGVFALPPCSHTLEKENAVEPTCTAPGHAAYWVCTTCGAYFADDKAAQEIDRDQYRIPATGHSFGSYSFNNDATAVLDGTETARCTRCAATHTRTKTGTVLRPERSGAGHSTYLLLHR